MLQKYWVENGEVININWLIEQQNGKLGKKNHLLIQVIFAVRPVKRLNCPAVSSFVSKHLDLICMRVLTVKHYLNFVR